MSQGLARTFTSLCLLCLAACSASDFDTAAGASAGTGGFGGSTTGGTAGAGAGGSDAAASGSAGAGGSVPDVHLTPSGSLEFRFPNITTQVVMGPSIEHTATQDRAFRLDLVANADGSWLAYVTPRWGFTTAFTGATQDGAIQLTGTLQIQSTHPSADGTAGALTDTWQTIWLGLHEDGTLDGTVSGHGEVVIESAGEGWSGELTGSGTLSADATPPEAAVLGPDPTATLNVGNLPFMGTSLLPWEPVLIRFAEPIALEQAKSHATTEGDNGESLGLHWGIAATPYQSVTADGVVLLAGLSETWSSDDINWQTTVKAGYADNAGLQGLSARASGSFVGLPAGTSSAEYFHGDGYTFHTWGATQLISPNDEQGLCEEGGCLQLGPVQNVDCGANPAGVVLRLSAPEGATSIDIRYRLLIGSDEGVAPSLGGIAPLSIQVARPGVYPVRDSVLATDVTGLGMDVGGYGYGTGWTTRTVLLPEGDGEVGVALRTGGSSADRTCVGSQDPGSLLNVKILVESISVTKLDE